VHNPTASTTAYLQWHFWVRRWPSGAGSAGLSLSAGCSGTVELLLNDKSKKGPSGQYEMTNTNVELRDGQSFAIAGLIDKRLTDGSSRRVI